MRTVVYNIYIYNFSQFAGLLKNRMKTIGQVPKPTRVINTLTFAHSRSI